MRSKQLIQDDYLLYEDRMMLEGTLKNGNSAVALNDIVVTRKDGLQDRTI